MEGGDCFFFSNHFSDLLYLSPCPSSSPPELTEDPLLHLSHPCGEGKAGLRSYNSVPISWFCLQSLVSSLFPSVFRRAPPGKCKYKPVPVKTKSKRVQFRPLASESMFVFRLRPWHRGTATVLRANSCRPGVAGPIFSPKAYSLGED